MKNNNKYITPTQINKFVSCKYKWYYETQYTQSELNKLYSEYKKENGITDSKQFAAFQRGNEFHSNFLKKQKLAKAKKRFILLLYIILGVSICLIFTSQYPL